MIDAEEKRMKSLNEDTHSHSKPKEHKKKEKKSKPDTKQ